VVTGRRRWAAKPYRYISDRTEIPPEPVATAWDQHGGETEWKDVSSGRAAASYLPVFPAVVLSPSYCSSSRRSPSWPLLACWPSAVAHRVEQNVCGDGERASHAVLSSARHLIPISDGSLACSLFANSNEKRVLQPLRVLDWTASHPDGREDAPNA